MRLHRVHGRFGRTARCRECASSRLPYTGSGLSPPRSGFDKVAANAPLRSRDRTPAWRTLPAGPRSRRDRPAMASAAAELGYPLVVKPRTGGSTMGCRWCAMRSHVPAWATAAAHGEVLCEKCVAGIEVTVGNLGDNPPRAFPTLEIV